MAGVAHESRRAEDNAETQALLHCRACVDGRRLQVQPAPVGESAWLFRGAAQYAWPPIGARISGENHTEHFKVRPRTTS